MESFIRNGWKENHLQEEQTGRGQLFEPPTAKSWPLYLFKLPGKRAWPELHYAEADVSYRTGHSR